MIQRYPANERGHLNHGWLDTFHTFSFGEYHDPERLGFRALRVINQDVVAPGQGFGMHPHRDMEIFTYIISGELAHRDSLGHESVIRPGRVQRMSAGTGIRHAEFNPSTEEPVHLLQIWLHPTERGLPPGYQELDLPAGDPDGRWHLVAAPAGPQSSDHADAESLRWHTDALLWRAVAAAGSGLTYDADPGRHLWLQMVTGDARVGDLDLVAGDGLAMSRETGIRIEARTTATVLLFDLA